MTAKLGPSKKKTDAKIYVEARKRLLDWLRKQLVGPGPQTGEDFTLVGVLPTDRYPCGALYPTSQWGDGIDPSNEEDDDVTAADTPDEAANEPAVVRRYTPPSSLGLSFFVIGDQIQLQVICSAAQYEPKDRDEIGKPKKPEWTRRALVSTQEDEEDFENFSCPGHDHHQSVGKLEGKARIDIRWRRFADGWIVTVSLCNTQQSFDCESAAGFVKERAQQTLFEACLRCVIDIGEVGAYPRVDRSLLDDEEQEIELQYAHRHVYAIGHGCAADWKQKNGQVIELCSDTMPTVEVPQMTADTGAEGEATLSLAHLAKLEQSHKTLLPELADFVNAYQTWVSGQKGTIAAEQTDDQEAAKRIVARMRQAVTRMRLGLKLLGANEQVRRAFALANRAMLNQMRQHDTVQGPPRADDAYRWRPFQLAFLLTTLESTANNESQFRDTVDLIWFPTGGGKTEAYLGLIAFQITLRRMRHPDTGGGTSVLMRYTLRLLARDQFVRAIRLICALELIRQECSDLGREPISIGMWVGGATSPNTFRKASELIDSARQSGKEPALVLNQCPWCAQKFSVDINYICTEQSSRFVCRNTACDFGATQDGDLPCNVVDEALYKNPPTMLVATVDKFARLAWEERANTFFGGEKHRPPELIVQDELHLISGALGSVAGLYEAAVDTVLQSRGVYPKYIASTATIRMAEQQVKRLYGRDLAVFPPPGLICDDSYFARTVPLDKRPGRLYLGYLAPMLNRQRCMAPLAAVLLLAPQQLFESDQDAKELLEAWWTQMVYHGSLKGVGNSHTAFVTDVRDFMRLLLSSQTDQPDADKPELEQRSSLAQLTGLQTAEENSAIFARLKIKRNEKGCLDAVLATNMISVGLDMARLALMVINGQPLTTAEYIQASSRVGRSDVPGLVVANYYRDQARSLSHYESFRPYHEAFYRFVEPSSVTPFTYQVRTRALHAAMVITIRHAKLGMLGNDRAGKLDPNDPKIIESVARLARRCQQADPDKAQDITRHVESLLNAWHNEVERCKNSSRQLSYQIGDQESGRDRLLFNHDDKIKGLWPTLQSFRNVENTALLKVI